MFFNDKSFYKKKKNVKCNKIFIAGMELGVGATHFSILLANYRTSLLKEKVAIIDFNKDKDYIFLGNTVKNKEVGKAFVKDGVYYYPCMTKDSLEEIFLKDYDCIIIDSGNSYMKYKVEAGLCDLRYLILSATLWKNNGLDERYNEYFLKYKNTEWRFLYSFGERKKAEEFEKRFERKIYRIPFINNPYKVERDKLNELKNAIGEV